MLVVIIGFVCFLAGWLLCAILSIGSKSDLELEILMLKKKLEEK